jgi:pimeloyl-ACP methyl ester carboxylesterase
MPAREAEHGRQLNADDDGDRVQRQQRTGAGRGPPVDTCCGDVCSTAELASWTGVPFTPDVPCDDVGTSCQLTMDVLAPTASGTRPIVLFVAGGPSPLTNQGYVMDAGFPVAVHDAVVMQPVWRQDQDQGGLADVVPGHRLRRRRGAPSGRTTAATRTAWSWSVTRSAAGRVRWSPCPRKTSHRPKAPATHQRLTAAGRVGHPRRCRRPRRKRPGPAGLPAWFLRRQPGPAPAALGQSDPFALAKTHSQVPVTVVHGTGDITVNPAVARAFAKALRHGGVDTHLVEVPEADHSYVLVAPAATDAIVAATAAAKTS